MVWLLRGCPFLATTLPQHLSTTTNSTPAGAPIPFAAALPPLRTLLPLAPAARGRPRRCSALTQPRLLPLQPSDADQSMATSPDGSTHALAAHAQSSPSPSPYAGVKAASLMSVTTVHESQMMP